jgi:hypothetical protein
MAVESLHLREHLGAEPITTWGDSPMSIEPLEQMEKGAPMPGDRQAGAPRSRGVPRWGWVPILLALAALVAWLLRH